MCASSTASWRGQKMTFPMGTSILFLFICSLQLFLYSVVIIDQNHVAFVSRWGGFIIIPQTGCLCLPLHAWENKVAVARSCLNCPTDSCSCCCLTPFTPDLHVTLPDIRSSGSLAFSFKLCIFERQATNVSFAILHYFILSTAVTSIHLRHFHKQLISTANLKPY